MANAMVYEMSSAVYGMGQVMHVGFEYEKRRAVFECKYSSAEVSADKAPEYGTVPTVVQMCHELHVK